MAPKLDRTLHARPRRLTIVALTLSTVAVVGAFLLDPLIVPIVVLVVFFLGFAASDHAKRDNDRDHLSA
jgi:hypothetical protein